jgi:glycerate-2-kinase
VAPGRLVTQALAEHADEPFNRYHLIAAGKAAVSMTTTFVESCPGECVAGMVVGPTAAGVVHPGIHCYHGGHPVPTAESVAAGREALALARRASAADQVVVLLSGGASSLLAAPAEGLELEDKMATTRALLRAGVTIGEMNAVRKHLSAVKGGWLAAACRGRMRTWAISDVVSPIEDDPAVIGSGPTVPDPSTFTDARDVLDRVGAVEAVPSAARARIDAGCRGELEETPKPGDRRLTRSVFRSIGTRRHAMAEAEEQARRLGYDALVWPDPVVGEAREAALAHLDRVLRMVDGRATRACVISSGETTVQVRGTGKGGRNQEFALALVEPLARLSMPIAVASVGTDGVDGPTDAAGAIVDGSSEARARERGVGPPAAFLAENDAYRFFERLDDLVITGPSGTNVADLQVVLVG